jgi:glycosyltransferase involved in cell wall biosynthesis|tara:strand:+ start:644 stop:1000 length:357 start_codon:yes stop_codon:yes gene_type:complete
MEHSSSKFKALAVSAGLSFWFFIISSITGMFSIEAMLLFILAIVITSQIFAIKLSKALDVFAIINTKIFLGILFIFLVSIYGMIFRLLKIDLLRLKKQKETYWLATNDFKPNKISKQY